MGFVSRLVVALVLAADCAGVQAAPDVLGIADALRPPSILSMSLSPDGRRLVAIAHANEAAAVLVMDTESLAARVVSGPAKGSRAAPVARWIGKDLIAVSDSADTLIIDGSGKVVRRVKGRYLRTAAPDAQGHERILTAGSESSRLHISRVDVRTGDASLMNFDMPGQPLQWVFDRDGVPLVVMTVSTARGSDATTVTCWHRRSLDDKWQALVSFPLLEQPWTPAYLTRDRQSLVVLSTTGRDTRAAFRFSLEDSASPR